MADLPQWVLDTNVIVSGLLSAQGPPGRLLDMVLARRLYLVLDDRIAAEYREVIARPKFAMDPSRIDAFLAILQFQEWVTLAPWAHELSPDPDDVMFLEAALLATDTVLVTGNTRHYPKCCRGPVKVTSPRDAWTHLSRG
ncbi:MAG: putative toxin-antitoxin system toxin component, PIN family [Kiritimatiellia bacterium]|nr:putative toxin-antitoxin system toxin component, PIN family [Kiritimatiellia bacterium]